MVDLIAPDSKEERTRARANRGKYAEYKVTDRAKIGKYTTEHGNECARWKFMKDFSNLKESTVLNFNKCYLEELKARGASPSVTNLTVKGRGRPVILGDLDDKLIHVLGAMQRKGGALNCHVLRATARALLKANPAHAAPVCTFNMPHSWVVLIYRRMGLCSGQA